MGEVVPLTTNTSGIKPFGYKVLIEKIENEEKTPGGIIIPDQVKDIQQAAQTLGRIIALSPMAFEYDDWPEDTVRPKVGDTVYFAKYSGASVKGPKDKKDYVLVTDKDIGAIIEE